MNGAIRVKDGGITDAKITGPIGITKPDVEMNGTIGNQAQVGAGVMYIEAVPVTANMGYAVTEPTNRAMRARTLRRIQLHVTQNTLNTASTVRARANAANIGTAGSIPALTTGWVDMPIDAVFTDGQSGTIQITAGGTGAQTITLNMVRLIYSGAA